MEVKPQENNSLGELTKALQNLEPIELSFNDIKAVKILISLPTGEVNQAFIVRKQDDKGITRFFYSSKDQMIVFDRAPEIWEKVLKNHGWSFVAVKMKK